MAPAKAAPKSRISQDVQALGITARTSKTVAQRGAGKKAATTRQANKTAAAPPGM